MISPWPASASPNGYVHAPPPGAIDPNKSPKKCYERHPSTEIGSSFKKNRRLVLIEIRSSFIGYSWNTSEIYHPCNQRKKKQGMGPNLQHFGLVNCS